MAVEDAWLAIVSSVSFLADPIIGPLAEWIFFNGASCLYGVLVNWVNFQVIKFTTETELTAYNNAVAALEAAQGTANGDPDALQQAQSDFNNNLFNLIHIDATTTTLSLRRQLYNRANSRRRVLWGRREFWSTLRTLRDRCPEGYREIRMGRR